MDYRCGQLKSDWYLVVPALHKPGARRKPRSKPSQVVSSRSVQGSPALLKMAYGGPKPMKPKRITLRFVILARILTAAVETVLSLALLAILFAPVWMR